MFDCVLDVHNITKQYKLYSSEIDRLKESFHPFKKKYHKEFYALKNVNFQIHRGEKVGIIGSNGAGKSTLLKIITGVINPTEGEIITDGKIAALLELGAGFNQDYTGIENIRLSGTLMGYTDEQIEDRMQKIIDFADIGDFINQPVKTYSSGMFVRLAFATQIFSDPDILIVDEALSVGDIRFQQKCYRAMDSMMQNKTVILVTHDTGAVTRFCNRVIWINHGEKVYDGDVVEGLQKYKEFLINQAIDDGHIESNAVLAAENVLVSNDKKTVSLPLVPASIIPKGNGKATITHCALFDENNSIIDTVEPKKMVKLVSRVEFKETIERPLYGFTLYDRLGNIMFSLNSEMIDVQLPTQKGIVEYTLCFQLPQLNQGQYSISVAVANGYQNDHVQLCWLDDALIFRVLEREYELPGFFYISDGEISVKVITN